MSFSISEVVVVLAVALLVIKPEQLPEVALTLGKLIRTARNLFGKAKAEVTGLIDKVGD